MKQAYRFLFLWTLVLSASQSIGQSGIMHLSGVVRSSSGNHLAGASVTLSDVGVKSVIAFAITDQFGKFHLSFKSKPDSLMLRIDHLEVEPYSVMLNKSHLGDTIPVHLWVLKERVEGMQEIKLKAPPLAYRSGIDTIEFRARSYKTVETRKVEDLLRNMQGFQLMDDGKVFFQGKEVDRILFDGEDLTDQNYRLLSRNLNADVVDRVQVIDNYHPDRLVQSIDRSGRIAVNLTIDSSYKFRVSGTVGLSSSDRRRVFDANLVFPGRRLKALSFLNFNEVGTATGTQLSEDRLGDSEGEGTHLLTFSHDLLELVSVPPPPLEPSYARDNKDESAMQVVSVKGKNGQSFRWLAGLGQSQIKRYSDRESALMRINGQHWLMQQSETYKSNTRQSLISMRYLHDRGGSYRGQIKVTFSSTGNGQLYSTAATGDLVDSLTEDAMLLGSRIRLEASETFSTGNHSLIRFTFQADAGNSSQVQDFQTERFLMNQLPFDPYSRYVQDFNRSVMTARSDLIYHRRQGKTRWSTGIRFYLDHERQQLQLQGANIAFMAFKDIHQNARNINSSKTMLYASRQININRKMLLNSGVEIGPSGMSTSNGIGIDLKERILHRASISLDYKPSLLNTLGIKIYRYKTLPLTDWFHTGPFLNSDGQVRTSANLVKPEVLNGISLSASRMNLARSFTGMMFLSITQQSNVYMAYADRSPGIYKTTYAPFDFQHALMLNGNLSKHFPNLFFKMMTEASMQVLQGETSIDGEMIRQSNGRISFQHRLISAFPFPINIELTYTANRITNSIGTISGQDMRAHQWQHLAVARLKYSIAAKASMNLLYGYRVLQEGNAFQTVDLYARWKASKSFAFSLTGHNLTNQRMLALRSLSLNATTDQRVSLVGRYILLGAEWSF